jgi:[ribosomal protein S5]-alanine N-acetyltransferase
MPALIQTERLSLAPLTLHESDFIQELVNTKGWLEFIGERHVHSPEEALAYCQKIIDSPTVSYWVVFLSETAVPIGIVTFIKRDYLAYHDIGFAFLPAYNGYGYAYEAAKAVLDAFRQHEDHEQMLATTVPENTHSIRLLTKLGFGFDKEIRVNDNRLLLFKLTSE